jgi:hypothetical protein
MSNKKHAERWPQKHPRECPTLWDTLPCVRCGKNERYLDLDICEPSDSSRHFRREPPFGAALSFNEAA